mgnify:CR=1 FL=1
MIRAVLFDRDGTLIADPGEDRTNITVMPHAAQALQRLRERGLRVGVVTNQPAIGQGILEQDQLLAEHDRIESLVGPIDGWFVCPHDMRDACRCRKPAPGLIYSAARAFGVSPHECIVVGDIESDLVAANSAGARAILVPTPVTLKGEIDRAAAVCRDLSQAVDRILASEAIAV